MVASPKSETTPPVYNSDQEKNAGTLPGKETSDGVATGTHVPVGVGKQDHTHRQLKSRHIQLIGIGGTIGTALYVSSPSLQIVGS